MIVFTNEHFTFTGNLHSWDDINTIFAYKVDLFTFDEICMDIFMANGNYLKIIESTDGWHEFLNKLNSRLSISDDWYDAVVKPAFTTNLTLVYDKEKRTQEVCEVCCYS
ncbi:hypothetical protein [Mucilaginibacter auburnensis]|uniref:Uncharacterized protein n=1 Tax=Mucilaginibacter auburnensis TaxID=1457233 RepID=A0A2H9VNJ7_9SPHI|nr:hypothetical protein [Mucilaginibacter auburnensis]PJJ79919.1 hypothetical protein CLV57_3058 [Mucilaginibacter auburnensis]